MNTILNIENVPKEVQLLLELIKEEQPIFTYIKNDKIDWDLFLSYSLHHRLYPHIHLKMKEKDFLWIPTYVKEQIAQHYKQNTFKMLQLSGEMSFINKLFSEHHIQTIFLKGPFLAKELYGDLSLRTSGDVDFIIPVERLQEAEKLLEEHGYEKDDYIETVLNDWCWRHHHVTYFHSQKRIKVEIHWRLHPGPGKETSFQELWSRKRENKDSQIPFYCLGSEDLFHFLSVHGARHGWSRLRWLDDMQQLLKHSLDWELIYSLYKRNHQLHIVGQVLLLTSQLLGAKTPQKMHACLKSKKAQTLAQQAIFYLEKMVNLHTPPLPKEIADFHSHHTIALMSLHQKSLYFLSLLYPFPEDAATLPLPKKWHFLYFPLRPFLWVWRKVKKPVIS